ncbi:MAG: formylmethanofuran dehydrogenase subunit B [Candidatus Bathyarchaeia archaeon]
MEKVAEVVCPFCGSCCDDIEVSVDANRVVDVRNACALGREKFMDYNLERLTEPTMRVDGAQRTVSLEEATARAAETLANAKYPVLHGWGCTSCEATAVGLELADRIGAVVDNVTTVCHGPSIAGVQDLGEATCTLGEVKNRADLIIYWASNAMHSHPRHMARYGPFSRGRFRASRSERKVIVVDVRPTHTAKLADMFLQIAPNTDYELLTALRMLVRGEEIDLDTVAGIPVTRLEALADSMVNCEFGVLFFGVGLTMSAGKHQNVEAALSLVRDLNLRTKFSIIPMRGHFNVTGANQVFTWQTGYPFCVDLTHGYPRYSPGETSIVDIALRRECDAALIVASDPIAHFPREAAQGLAGVPLIAIDPHLTPTTALAQVAIPAAHVGIEAPGTVYRMDGVALSLKKLVEPPPGVKSDVEVLRMILEKVEGVKR